MTKKIGQALLYAFGFTIISIIILGLIITSLAYFELVSVNMIGNIIYVCSMCCFFFSALIAAKTINTRGWMLGGLVGLIFITLTALYRLIGVEHALTTAFYIRSLCILVICMAGGMIGVNLPSKSSK